MRQFTDYIGTMSYPVISFRRSVRYNDQGEKTDILDSRYTILYNYEQINITVPDDGIAVTSEQVKNAANAGTPIVMEFTDLELTVRGTRNPWELQASGRASQVVLVNKSK